MDQAQRTGRWRRWIGAILLATAAFSSAPLALADCTQLRTALQNAKDCKALATLEPSIAGSDCTDAQKTQIRNEVEAHANGWHCGCEQLTARVEQVEKAKIDALSCKAAVELSSLLRQPGKCRALDIKQRADAAVAALTPRLQSDECKGYCEAWPGKLETELATRPGGASQSYASCLGCPSVSARCSQLACQAIDRATDAQLPTLRGMCGGCSAATRQRCFPNNKLTRVATTDEVLTNLERRLDALNTAFQEQACSAPDSCGNLQQERLDVLSAYMTLLRTVPPSDAVAKAHSDHALAMLRSMGLQGDLWKAVVSFSKEDIELAVALHEAATNPELLERLLAAVRSLPGDEAKALSEELDRDGADLGVLLMRLTKLPPEQRAFFRNAGWIGIDENRLRGLIAQQIGESQLDIWLPTSSASCDSCPTFWRTLESEMRASTPPQVQAVANVDEAVRKDVAARIAICAQGSKNPKQKGCGVVIGVTLEQQSSVAYRATATTHFVVSEEPRKPVTISVLFERGHEKEGAVALATRLAFSFDRLRGLPIVESRALKLAPAPYCGVSLLVDPSSSPPTRAPLIVTAAGDACEAPELLASLRAGIREYGLESLTPIAWKPRAQGSATRGQLKCGVTLSKAEHLYSAAVLVDLDAPCPDDAPKRLSHAGQELARGISLYYNGATTVRPLSPPPFSHALLFSGARQLEWSRGKSGWSWALGEAGLLVAGTAFTLLAVNAKNDADARRASSSKANVFLGVGLSSFGLVLPLRALAGATCCD